MSVAILAQVCSSRPLCCCTPSLARLLPFADCLLQQLKQASMAPKRSHGHEWLQAVESRLGSPSSTIRMSLKRQRDRGEASGGLPRTPGRRRQDVVEPRSVARRLLRDSATASSIAAKLIRQCLRLRIILKSRLSSASDCRRMMRVAAAVRARGASLTATLLILLVDRAFRRPALSSRLVQYFGEYVKKESDSVTAAWKAFCRVRRSKEAVAINAHFWKGPASLHCRDMIRKWKARDVIDVVQQVAFDGNVVNAKAATDTLSELPHLSRYGAFHLIRLLPACVGVVLEEDEAPAAVMSNMVGMLEKFVPLRTAVQMATSASKGQLPKVGPGDGALLLCEAGKALVVLGVLPASTADWSEDVIRTCLACRATKVLLQALTTRVPLTDAQIWSFKCTRSSETRLVDAAVPKTRRRWDCAPHFCQGAEMLAGLMSQTLRQEGWLDPAFGADVFHDSA
jgi:hypothetical protein